MATKPRRGKNSPDLAPRTPVEEDPKSLLNQRSTTQDEQEALRSKDFRTINIDDLEMRIGLMARMVLEHYLRGKQLGPKDKCDIALRAISTLEGAKQEIVWRDELKKKPKTVDFELYAKERALKEQKLEKILLRRKEVKVLEAERAVQELQKQQLTTSTHNSEEENGET
jgi:hypothetical protein